MHLHFHDHAYTRLKQSCGPEPIELDRRNRNLARFMDIYRNETSTRWFRLKARLTHPEKPAKLSSILGLLWAYISGRDAPAIKHQRTPFGPWDIKAPKNLAWAQYLDHGGHPFGEPRLVDAETLEPADQS